MTQVLYKILLVVAGVVIGLLLSLRSCSNINTKPANLDSFKSKYDSINIKLKGAYLSLDILKLNNDSLVKVKSKVITKYITARTLVLAKPCDTNVVIRFVNIADSVIRIDSTQIISLNKTINVQDTIIKDQHKMLGLDSLMIKGYDVNLKIANKALRKQKVKTFIVGSVGAVAVALVTYFSFIKK